MRTVIAVEEGVLELNWLWLPTCIGMNAMIKQDMEEKLRSKIEGQTLSEKTLDDIHEMVVAYLCDRMPEIDGLDRHLDSLKFLTVQ